VIVGFSRPWISRWKSGQATDLARESRDVWTGRKNGR
jgi:hypothetical protein